MRPLPRRRPAHRHRRLLPHRLIQPAHLAEHRPARPRRLRRRPHLSGRLARADLRRPTYAQIARWIEENAAAKNLALHNELINAVLLAQEYEASGRALAERTASQRGSPWIPHVLREIDAGTARTDLAATVPWKQQFNAWCWALAFAALSAGTIALFPGVFVHGWRVLIHPGQFVPHVGAVKIVLGSVHPGDDTVLAGESVNFSVAVEAPDGRPVPTEIAIQYASGRRVSFPMTVFGAGNSQYRYSLATVAESLDYIITAGDTQSERYHIDVLPRIHLVNYRLTVTPPAYTSRAKHTITILGKDLTAAKGSLEVPMGSTIEIAVTLNVAVKSALFDLVGANPVPLAPSADGRTFTTTRTLKDNERYALRINDGSNRTLARFPEENGAVNGSTLGYFVLTCTADQPPTIQITEPARDLDAKPGDVVPLAAQANDDYGVTQIRLEIAQGADGAFVTEGKPWTIATASDGTPVRSYAVKHLLDLPASKYKFGDTLRYRFVAVDNRNLLSLSSDLGPQTTAGQVFSINFTDKAALAEKSTKLWEDLRKKLTAFLDRQVKLRQDANALALTPLKIGLTTQPAAALVKDLGEAKTLSGKIAAGQSSLRADMAALARDFPFEASMKLIQKSLQVLVTDDATSAVDRAADLQLLSDLKAMPPLATKLRQHQSRIIDVLQALLAISATEENHAATILNREGGEVPNEAKEAWKKLADDLKTFEKEQKQVIDATAELGHKPKDQFDKDDIKKLEALAAAEDKWEKFLTQRLADMSKIAEQDQANVSLLDEMVQMKVELAMAKNALEAKAQEIATPLEENGLENASKLTTHIERWLMQQPDRTNWQMEEPVNQTDTKMAELPKQLQDMVGDLMDQEEDLTDEMESAASKWNDSLDKGAGWDAGEGPISNESAQGVTGNQMPKNNEIQGRSGEGREGKASGEMVGAEAEGKGGRRTPTRMTQDPFSSGQVNDKSKDPAGGATGGGKKGQFGGQGLEGQGPDSPTDPTQRLQGKQAQLRNEAERLELQMRAQGFNNFKLIEAAVYMQKADDSLKANRYDNALYYQKQAVQALNTAKVLSAGEMHVTMDTTPTVNEKVQKEIEDALNGVMPKGYADPVKAYFTRLSNEGSQAP